jgi:hypothetical protein
MVWIKPLTKTNLSLLVNSNTDPNKAWFLTENQSIK